jgi:hypothetical protein
MSPSFQDIPLGSITFEMREKYNQAKAQPPKRLFPSQSNAAVRIGNNCLVV